MQSDTLEERYAIKFCFQLEKNPTKMYGMLQTALGPSCMNQASVFERHKRIKERRESVRDDERFDTLTQEDFHGAFQKLLERYKCIAAEGYYFEGGLEFYVCTINKSDHTK